MFDFDYQLPVIFLFPLCVAAQHSPSRELGGNNGTRNIQISWAAFEKTTLETVNIPSSVKRIEKYAFNECRNLKNVTISEGVEEIGYSAFAKTALESIKIPESVKNIDSYVFFNCNNLIEVTFKSNNPKNYINNIFFYCQNNIKLYVPSESVDLYSNWLPQDSNVTIYEINNEEG